MTTTTTFRSRWSRAAFSISEARPVLSPGCTRKFDEGSRSDGAGECDAFDHRAPHLANVCQRQRRVDAARSRGACLSEIRRDAAGRLHGDRSRTAGRFRHPVGLSGLRVSARRRLRMRLLLRREVLRHTDEASSGSGERSRRRGVHAPWPIRPANWKTIRRPALRERTTNEQNDFFRRSGLTEDSFWRPT